MAYLSASETRFLGNTDSETLQNLIDYAEKNEETTVIIPRKNARTGKNIYIIDKCVYLPSNITVILDDCHLRLADGVRENIFRNRNLGTELGKTLEGEQHDIRLIGQGKALLDGGEPNGLCEQLRRDFPDKYPPMMVNLLVFFSNVRDFEVRNIKVKDSRWWSFCFIFCRWGMLSDLDFEMHGNLENQDGIDLRVGCEYITIQNITGITGDDTVALTALPMGYIEQQMKVEGKSVDIHDVTIQNVMSSSHGCSLVRFLNEDGAREYNITVDNVKDTGITISSAAILFGETYPFAKKQVRQMGEFENFVIRNVTTNAQRGINLCEATRNLIIENLTTYGRNEIGINAADNFACENLVIRNFTFDSDEADADCVFQFGENAAENMKDYEISHVRAKKAKHVFRGSRLEVEDFKHEEPSVSEFEKERAKLCSAYGRYHFYFFGKEIMNRPKDNRFTGEKKN